MERANSPVTAEAVREAGAFVQPLLETLGKVVVGQHGLMERLLTALLANGHVLVEGVPGLAKTLTVKVLAEAIRGRFQRIQFTPDLLPADLIGTQIFQPRTGEFTVQKGPVFTNLLLADEINRAPAKLQSALLEAMQERQVTIGGETFRLVDPFLVMATQNPIEQEGTYPLPEAQKDRFLLKVLVGYPARDEEREILKRMAVTLPDLHVHPVVGPEEILRARAAVDRIYVDGKIEDYILDLVGATRAPKAFGLGRLQPLIRYGASPRATLGLAVAARAWAFLQGREYVVPGDVKAVGLDVLRHRVIPSYEAEAEEMTSEEIVGTIFDTVKVP